MDEPDNAKQTATSPKLERIRRIHFVVGEDVDRETGPIELTFSDGHVELYDVAGDGRRLRTDPHPWYDTYAEPLSSEDREYVDEYGKWTAFDVSDDPDYALVLRATVGERTPIMDGPRQTGLVLRIGSSALMTVRVESDDLYVVIAAA